MDRTGPNRSDQRHRRIGLIGAALVLISAIIVTFLAPDSPCFDSWIEINNPDGTVCLSLSDENKDEPYLTVVDYTPDPVNPLISLKGDLTGVNIEQYPYLWIMYESGEGFYAENLPPFAMTKPNTTLDIDWPAVVLTDNTVVRLVLATPAANDILASSVNSENYIFVNDLPTGAVNVRSSNNLMLEALG